jgi:AraC-like DNA-binding protein
LYIDAQMLKKTVLFESRGLALVDVRCSGGPPEWSPPERARGHGLVFVRSGCFRRKVDGVESVLEPNVVYFEQPGQEQQIAHVVAGGEACTWVSLSKSTVSSLWDGEVPLRPVFTSPRVDVMHRLVLSRARQTAHPDELAEDLQELAAAAFDLCRPERAPDTKGHGELVDSAREALAADPTLGLAEIARQVCVSPWHLSRIFRRQTQETVSRYRNRLRVRLALERLAEGEESLARLAADLSFTDQAHLSRVVRRELGTTPSALRDALCTVRIQ